MIMKMILSKPKYAVISSVLLALPFLLLFTLFITGLEPNIEPLSTILNPEKSHMGSFIVLGFLLLLMAGGGVSGGSVAHSLRQGKNLRENLGNLLLTLVIVMVVVALCGAIIVDQYPCWMGIPNCD